jgi:hypothetical protein
MPAFTFEKIEPPAPPGPPPVKEHRGVLVQFLDRLVETRAKRTTTRQEGVVPRHQQKSSE